MKTSELLNNMGERYQLEHSQFKEDRWVCNDTESGNWILYDGNSIEDAVAEILNDMESEDPAQWDLYKNGDRIWCGATDSISELKALIG